MGQGVSKSEFARREGCDESLVRRKVKSGHLLAFADGTIDPELVGSGWRRGSGKQSDSSDKLIVRGPTNRAAAKIADDQPISIDGRTFHSKAQAERMKENYLAKLRQIDFDRAAGAVVDIDDVVNIVVAEYQLVRNKLLALGARIAPRAAVMKSAEEVKALIDREVNSALEELAFDGDADGDLDEADEAVKRRLKQPS
ncbi:hypothetical protein [Devosia sp. 919]|uniref:hypothetical protein n=1 Tax=Devosia sp. 919 TaxID=2726065 RepID=UPI001556CFD9|nr:hypothetical protein [Devosia sp. 919]